MGPFWLEIWMNSTYYIFGFLTFATPLFTNQINFRTKNDTLIFGKKWSKQTGHSGWTVHLLSNRIIKKRLRKEAEKWQDKSWFDLTCNDTAKIDMMFKSATKTELWLDLRRFIMEANYMWSSIWFFDDSHYVCIFLLTYIPHI